MGSRPTAAAISGRSSGVAPTRCIPVSTLTWTALRRPDARAPAAKAAMASAE